MKRLAVVLTCKRKLLMRKISLLPVVLIVLMAVGAAPGRAQDFKPYPGSKADEKASREASAAAPGKESQVYHGCARQGECVLQRTVQRDHHAEFGSQAAFRRTGSMGLFCHRRRNVVGTVQILDESPTTLRWWDRR